MLKSIGRAILKFCTRLFPQERGKFKILNTLYFPFVAPSNQLVKTTKLSFDITMDLDLSEFLQSHLYLYGSYELPTVKFIRKHLVNGGVCFDVGAQIGYLSLAMATAANNCSVFAFEPEPINLSKLSRNISLNNLKNISIIDKAVSSSDGVIKLYMSNDHNAGTHSTVQNLTNVSSDFIEIPCVTLDSFVTVNEISRLDLIKIDVEGGELEVIQGAIKTLELLKPVIIMEMADSLQNARQFSTIQFKNFLLELGYHSHTINDDGTLKKSTVNTGHVMENVVFIHQDQISR